MHKERNMGDFLYNIASDQLSPNGKPRSSCIPNKPGPYSTVINVTNVNSLAHSEWKTFEECHFLG
jgi:hypothetical protein